MTPEHAELLTPHLALPDIATLPSVLMQSFCHIPSGPLSAAVTAIYLNRAPEYAVEELMIPTQPELWCSLGERFEWGTLTVGTFAGHGWLSGLQTRPVRVSSGGAHLTIGILFQPWGLYQCLQTDPTALINQTLPASPHFQDTVQRLLHQYNGPDLLSQLEEYLLQHFPPRPIPSYIPDIIAEICRPQPTRLYVRELSRRADIATKTLIGQFGRTIGLSPLRYIHLRQIQQAALYIRNRPDWSLTDIGYETGFADQAHFVRIFGRMTGMSPGRFRAFCRALTASR